MNLSQYMIDCSCISTSPETIQKNSDQIFTTPKRAIKGIYLAIVRADCLRQSEKDFLNAKATTLFAKIKIDLHKFIENLANSIAKEQSLQWISQKTIELTIGIMQTVTQ